MVLLDFSMTPLGKGESVSPYVARCLEIVAASGLDYRLHAMGTTLEGELDEVLAVVRRCFEALQPDCNRISCSIKIDYRKSSAGRLRSKIEKVQGLVNRPLKTGDEGGQV
ncbi:MAG TPA: MTH1187 family thiamine-binding protein [Gemmataceae bacterium]|nr:MTH1187 family thiamine-binding protein [Gemmataceae bacterium]